NRNLFRFVIVFIKYVKIQLILLFNRGDVFMKHCITLLSLGLCLVSPLLSQASDIKPLIHVTNVHNGQYDEALDAITDTKIYGPYQFRVLKDAIETQGETKDINGRVFRTSDGVFMHVKARSVDNGSTSLDKEVKKIIKDRTIPEPTVKMVLYLLSMM
ncbi:MAG: hypothetical protein Q621_VSBC00367G0007, partial [Veillonella sp. DORA_B_18_19_23]